MAFLFVKASKLLFFSAGAISTLLMVKGALLLSLYEIFFPNLVAFWNFFMYFLSSPLYICIIINSIVLLIAVTSTFHHHHDNNHNTEVEAPPPETRSDLDDLYCTTSAQTLVAEGEEDEKSANSVSRDEGENVENETMESTWKAIASEKAKKLSKSKTMQERPKSRAEDLFSGAARLRESERFDGGVSMRRVGGMRRDPWIGIEEFNQQVEAFINKFNQDMRLQRQESDQRFLDMIKQGLE